jgi:hypothetical protein
VLFAWRGDIEAQTLQDLNGIVGMSIEDDTAMGKRRILPLTSLTAEGQHTILEGTIEEEFAVKSNRLRAENPVFNLFHSVASFSRCRTKAAE